MKINYIWKLWAKSIGEKSGTTDKDSDRIALIRTIFVIIAIAANLSILAVNIPKIMNGYFQ